MGFVVEIIVLTFTYMVSFYQTTFAKLGLPELVGKSRPDIFHLDRRIADRDSSFSLADLRNGSSTKGTIGTILELLVSPRLSKKQKSQIKKWDDKVDAALAVAIFAPKAINKINDQVKSLTKNKLDIYDVDAMMHKALGKRTF